MVKKLAQYEQWGDKLAIEPQRLPCGIRAQRDLRQAIEGRISAAKGSAAKGG